MALIFKAEHVPMILNGTKTATRRLWKAQRVREDSVQKLYSGGLPISPCYFCRGAGTVGSQDAPMPCPICDCTGRLQPFASARILAVYQQIILSMTAAQIAAEGYPGWTVEQFAQKLIEVNRLKMSVPYVLHLAPYVVEFELEAPR